MNGRWILGITGASGAPYAVRLLEAAAEAGIRADVIVSAHGWRLLAHETGLPDLAALRDRLGARAEAFDWFGNADRGARPASGSAPYAGMVICPCSMGTLSAVAHGSSRSLVERAADVTLKEGRRLILVPREMPLSPIHLENMLSLSRIGVTVMPAAPGFYHAPKGMDDLIDFVVARVLDHMGAAHSIGYRWTGEEESEAGRQGSADTADSADE
ncbi:MAG: flavin prenyltransferase UbiX [Gemmatimonadota bacterium]